MFINPIKDGYLTSPFGLRRHPVTGVVNSRHQGVDISRRPNTNVEIMASLDGDVIRTGALSTYGNIVIIRHKVNGKTMETLYAHLKHSTVKKGQRVKQGQTIGIMGNTGQSTAPHLHFEIHNGVWASGQPNAVDPQKYIELYREGELNAMKNEIASLKKTVASQQQTINQLVASSAKIKSSEPASDYAKEALQTLVDLELMKGDTSGHLNPKGAITRQDFAVVIARLLNYLDGDK